MRVRERLLAEWATPEIKLGFTWIILIYVWSCLAAPDGYLLSFDDVWRLVHAHEASQGALAPSDVWPPLPFWVVGLLLRLGFSSTFAPQFLGILITGGALVQIWRLAGELGLGPFGRAACSASMAILPGILWLAPSALVETWTLLAFVVALRAVRTWWIEDDAAQLTTAFAALALGGVLRYEAWGWAIMLIVACRAAQDEGRSVAGWRRGVIGVLVFPLVWCVYQFAATGSPFTFGEFARDFLAEDHPDAGPFSRLAEGTRALSQLVEPLALAGAFGWLLGGKPRGGTVVGTAIVLVTSLQLVAHALGFAGLHNVWRHYLPLALGFALGVGLLVDRASRLGSGPALGVLALSVQVESLFYEWPDSGYSDGVGRVARQIRRLHAELGGNILVEGVGYDSRVLQILAGDMDDVVFDRLIWLVALDRPMTKSEKDRNRSLLEQPYSAVVSSLQRDNVRVLAVFSDEANEIAGAFGSVEYAAAPEKDGRWTVLRVTTGP